MSTLRWGVIGLGRIVRTTIAPAMVAEPKCELVAGVSRDQGRADARATSRRRSRSPMRCERSRHVTRRRHPRHQLPQSPSVMGARRATHALRRRHDLQRRRPRLRLPELPARLRPGRSRRAVGRRRLQRRNPVARAGSRGRPPDRDSDRRIGVDDPYPSPGAHRLSLLAYTRAVLAGETPNASAADGLRSMRLCEAMARSVAERRVVDVEQAG